MDKHCPPNYNRKRHAAFEEIVAETSEKGSPAVTVANQ